MQGLVRQEDGKDKDLTTCKSEDLNPNGYLGSKNGVVELRSGRMLEGNEAREKFVTKSLPDDFVPDAKDRMRIAYSLTLTMMCADIF